MPNNRHLLPNPDHTADTNPAQQTLEENKLTPHRDVPAAHNYPDKSSGNALSRAYNKDAVHENVGSKSHSNAHKHSHKNSHRNDYSDGYIDGYSDGKSQSKAHNKAQQPSKYPRDMPAKEAISQASHASHSSGSSQGSLLKALAVMLLFVVLLAGSGAAYVYQQLSPVDASDHSEKELEVLPGWGAARIGRELEAQGLLRNGRLFAWWLRYQERDRNIGEGLYRFTPAMDINQIAEVLEQGGRPRVVRVVIPEGFRAVDVAERLSAAGFGYFKQLLMYIRNPSETLRSAHIPEGATLEGFLFPASYDIPLGSSPAEALQLMLLRFTQELDSDVEQALQQQDLDVYAWVTLASMVQSEAGNDDEMATIAGVFFNRLDIDMRLQSDPTVAYGLNKRMPELNFAAGDFSQDHPWNTYTRGGLPQGPISNPGRAALRAVLAPERYNSQGERYYYFLHGRDGSFVPNLTFQDHQRDVAIYLR